jgi:hypothetical protein
MFNVLQSNDLSARYSSKNSIYGFILIILLSASFILLSIREINQNTDPQDYDTTGYLGEANFLKYHGGIDNFIDLCLTGIYKQANQHPLYILFLTPFASMDISFFIYAKIISAVFGLILLLLLFIIGRKMYGDLIASVAVLALLLNSIFIDWTTMVACESLLMVFSLLCIYFAMEGFKNNKNWIYAGVFAGLSYLTKGTGILLVPGFLISAIIIYKLDVFKNKFFWLFFIVFTLTASPLLIRNFIVYQNPLYNVNSSIVTMGNEKINKTVYTTFDLKEGVAIWKYEKSEIDVRNETKSKTYQQKFNVDLFDLSEKIIKDAEVFLDTLNISWFRKLPDGVMRIFTLLLLAFFLIGISRERNKGGKLYFIITLLIFLLSLLMMPISRYFLPMIPFVWIYIALGIFTVLDLINKKFLSKLPKITLPGFGLVKTDIITVIPLFLILFLVVFAGFMITKKEMRNPLNSVVYSESRLDLLNWLRETLKNDDLYTMGPNFNWQLEKGTRILPPRITYGDFSKFQSFIKRHQVSYIIIDSHTLGNFENPRNAFDDKIVVNQMKSVKEYFVNDPINGVVEKKRVDSWNLVYMDQKKPTDFLVYELID